jgi:ketosteroid isomerase-like protein
MIRNDSKAEAAVRAVLDKYADAVYRADVETLKNTFHPTAVMNGYLGDRLLLGGPEPFLADIGGHPSMAESGALFKAEFSAILVSGRAATATLEENGFFGTGHFVNYFHLLNEAGKWKIVSKTFESLP